MRKQPFAGKPLHHHLLKEAQLIDTLGTLMTTVTHPQQLTMLADEDIKRIADGNATATKQLRATLQLAHLLAVPQKRQHFTVRLPSVFCNSKMQSLAANLCRTLPTSIQKNLGRLHAG
ncbi:hypothetical protein V5G20_04455 [Brevibacillus borstelensis]|uniref:hypothetical protein n=1 Tax=Brevibacillus borstelensis TaxID=45462 RepID=UPI0030D4792D